MKKSLSFLLAFVFALLAPFCQAHIYGYVDHHGKVHLADHPVDHRYKLFKKEHAEMAPLPKAKPVLMSAQKKSRYDHLVNQVASRYGVDSQLLHAMISVESAYNPHAVSHRGAVGLMQIVPETAHRFGVKNLHNPQDNLRAGAEYIRYLMQRFNHNLPLVIAAYNAGEGAVEKYGNRIPPYAETRAYVAKVMATYRAQGNETWQSALEQSQRAGLIHVGGQKRVTAILSPNEESL